MFLIPGNIIAALTFPGVVVHELAHFLFCRLFKVPVYQVCYFQAENPAGYVIHQEPRHWGQSALIAMGPFFLNSILGSFFAFPSVLRAFEFEGATSLADQILIWLGISIAMHAIPSKTDIKSMWQSVSGVKAPWLAKVVIAPVAGLMHVLALGSIIWLDLLYGVCIIGLPPHILVGMLT